MRGQISRVKSGGGGGGGMEAVTQRHEDLVGKSSMPQEYSTTAKIHVAAFRVREVFSAYSIL